MNKTEELIELFLSQYIQNDNNEYINTLMRLIKKEAIVLQKVIDDPYECAATAINNVGQSIRKVIEFNYRPLLVQELKDIEIQKNNL